MELDERQFQQIMERIGEVMGQTRESVSIATSALSFSAKGLRGKDYLLGVTIDDMALNVTNADGDLSPDLTPVRGKSFDMTLSPLGIEVDVSGAEAITYEMVNGTRSVASGFKLFFPDLPDRAVKVGDSWPSSAVVEDKAGMTEIRLEFQSVNTLEGFEAVDGMECARISSKLTGTISGTGSQEGADLLFAGTTQGTDLWYFAVKEGLCVKSTSDSVTKMTISVTGPMTLTIPTTQTRKGEVHLVGR
ncbi:MAG: hypothetical protein E4H35_04560 [Candidatus Aminicenantes bacterium]|nr:MAG: hypothetical protein E4H35_04560 [Candidatus Aminicenantes bacterium]